VTSDFTTRVSTVWRRAGELPLSLPQPSVDLLVFTDGTLWLSGPETVARTGTLTQPLTGVRTWVNGKYVAWVKQIPARRAVRLDGREFVDSTGQQLRLGDEPIQKIELQSNGEFYRVTDPAIVEPPPEAGSVRADFPPPRP
jgi:hypothetical protein